MVFGNAVTVRNEPRQVRRVCFPNEMFVKRDFAAIYRCQRTWCSAIWIRNLFSTALDYPSYRVEVIGAPDTFISGFPSWQ
jgi:hypothetical protein